MKILIKNAHLKDPVNNIDEKGDVYIVDGKIRKDVEGNAEEVINAEGLLLIPGLIDIHSHFREPGKEDAETILTGSMAALRGGFTSVCVMPNTNPPIDNEGVARFILEKSDEYKLCRVFPIGAITKERNGCELSEMGHLVDAGCVALSDDGNCIMDSTVMRSALEYSLLFDIPLIQHSEDMNLTRDGQMNEGVISTRLGFKGIPDISESSIVARDILLAEFTSSRLHLAHISAEKSIRYIKAAKDRGIKVTSEVTPHHLILTEEEVLSFDTNTKMKPPLRTEKDRGALRNALKNGIIDVIATDHAPHPDYEKELEYSIAPFGVTGLETAFSVIYTELVEKQILSMDDMIRKMSYEPSRILKVPHGEIKEGAVADLTLINPDKEWVVREDGFFSKSRNSPFIGWKLKGVIEYTLVDGRVVFQEGEFPGLKSC